MSQETHIKGLMHNGRRWDLVLETARPHSSAGTGEPATVDEVLQAARLHLLSNRCSDADRFIARAQTMLARTQPQPSAGTDRAADLTDAQLDDLRSHIRGGQPSETGTYDYELGSGWRCFHCGEIFKTPAGAALHFGKPTDERPRCAQIMNTPWKGNLTLGRETPAIVKDAGIPLIDEDGVAWAVVFPDDKGLYDHGGVIVDALRGHRAAPQRSAGNDIVTKLVKIANASRREDGSDIPLGETLRDAATTIGAQAMRLEACDVELAKLRSAVPQTVEVWRPIETAPRDGSKIDGWLTHTGGKFEPYRKPDIWWSDQQQCWKWDGQWGGEQGKYIAITHWMPRPSSPLSRPHGGGAA